jgi:hypothetical protein
MHLMRSLRLAFVGAVALCAAVSTAASAAEVKIGQTKTPMVAPVCPTTQKSCNFIVPKLTVLNVKSDGVTSPMMVRNQGELVSFKVGVSSITSDPKALKADLSFAHRSWGGPAEVELAVLQRVGKKSKQRWALVAHTPAYQVEPYLGQVVQFPLAVPLPVVPGERVGLTVPTWAPILSIDLTANKFSYEQSRTTECTKAAGTTPVSQAQLTFGQQSVFGCTYLGTRVQYSALEITTPTPTSIKK